jgi:hydroxypyruvate isomerase
VARLAANLSWLFTDLPLLDRPPAAAACGFTAVEFGFPYGGDVDASALRAACDGASVEVVLVNAPAGDWDAGDRGLAGIAARRGEFEASLDAAAEVASILGAPRVHVLAGTRSAGATWSVYLDGLAMALDTLNAWNITVMVEPLNPTDVPGYLLADLVAATNLVFQLGSGAGLQGDLYHLGRIGAPLPEAVVEVLHAVGHVQVASVPDRAEPGPAECGWLDAIDEAGYEGWVGLEYRPADPSPGGTERGLAASPLVLSGGRA